MKKKIEGLLSVIILMIAVSTVSEAHTSQLEDGTANLSEGVWNNFDFSRPAEDWSAAAHTFGGEDAVIDLVVAQANINGLVYLPFPFESEGYLYSSSQTDKVEPYLDIFDSEALKVILSIQPLKANVTQLIEILLSRYGDHDSLIGVNVDVEWKESGEPTHVSNEERDAWLNTIKRHNSSFKLFLTYFKDHTHFPDDAEDLVILFDGEADTQKNLLKQYEELAEHYNSAGIYTGYSSCAPPTASYERIISAVPNTEYIIHTEDVFSDMRILIFEMDDLQVDWLESTTINLIDIHMDKLVPVILGVIPNNFDNPNVGGGYLANHIEDLDNNYFDIFEIGQHGYTHDASEELRGKSYEEQKQIIENGFRTLTSIGIEPFTFIPPFGSADETTLNATEDQGLTIFVDLYGNLNSDELLILDSWVSLTERIENRTVLKSAEQIMSEIDQKPEEKAVIILYQIHDFQTDSRTKRTEFSKILDTLKNSEKYLFLTAKQYQEALSDKTLPTPTPTPQSPRLLDWILYPIFGALALVTLTLLIKKRPYQKDRKRETS